MGARAEPFSLNPRVMVLSFLALGCNGAAVPAGRMF